MKCKICGTKFEPKLFLQKHCNNYICKDKWRKLVLEEKKQLDNNFISKYRPIKKVSDKKALQDIIYKSERIKFLSLPENKICFIDGCNKLADTIEHIMKRKGFADKWAKDNNISLYLDQRFWKPCCNAHNLELENNSELSKKYQYSNISGKKKSDL